MNAFLELEFTDDLTLGQEVIFDYTDGVSSVTVKEEWADVRYKKGIAAINTPTAISGEASAISFYNAFISDYNVSDFFKVEILGNKVTITVNEDGITFDNIQVPSTIGTNTGGGIVPNFTIDNVFFTTTGDCSTINVNVETNLLADEVLQPFQEKPTTNPIIFQWNRNEAFELQIKRGGTTKYLVIGTPARIFPSGINLTINDNPAGSSVTIVTGGYLLNLTYSLNGIDYQNSNVFSNLVGGVYNAYVKDQFGCITTKEFELDGFGINSPFFYIPTANSIRFANRVNWGDCSNYKNDFNTLSCESNVILPKEEVQQFQTCDVITTQFKSNYRNNTVKINDNLFPLQKITNFMRRKDKRDAKITSLEDGTTRSGIYFNAGNLYDYDTDAIIGDYTLNGALPEWGKAGNFVLHPNGNWYLIEDVIYLDSRDAEVLVIDTGVAAETYDINIKVACFYNLHNYEVFQFKIDFSTYNNKYVQIKITGVDTYFDEVNFISEKIEVKVRHKNTIEIRYSDDENTDMFYSTGIENKMRMEIEKVYGQPAGSIESYDTDDNTVLLNADIRQLDVFEFSPMTKAMMWKIDEALSHRYVLLDGVPYGDKQIEVSEALEDTNLYDVKATMKKSNSVYRSGGITFDESGLEIPALIPTGTGYVKYQ